MNLVLLVGTNPLPNYVVSKYLIPKKNIKKVFLVYSEETEDQKGTKEYADKIRELLSQKFKDIEYEDIPLSNVGNCQKIRNEISTKLNNLQGKSI